MSLPPLTEFDDPVARFLEWHHIRFSYLGNDDAAMAKSYPQAKKQLKKWEVAFISLPKDSWAKGFFMSIVGPDAWQGAEIADDANTEMAMMHHRMAIGMPWTADQGLAFQWQKYLEQDEDGELLNDETGFRFRDELPNSIAQYKVKKKTDTKRFSNLATEEQKQEIIASLDHASYVEAIVKAAEAKGVEITTPEYRERMDAVVSEVGAALQLDPSSHLQMQGANEKLLLHFGVTGKETPPWHQFKSLAEEEPIKDESLIKSAKVPVEQPALSTKAFTVEQALLNPKASKDRSKYKSAYFLWGQIKSHHNVGERFKLIETQASTWAGVAKGQHTKDVIKVLVDVRAIEKIKRTLDYRRLV